MKLQDMVIGLVSGIGINYDGTYACFCTLLLLSKVMTTTLNSVTNFHYTSNVSKNMVD